MRVIYLDVGSYRLYNSLAIGLSHNLHVSLSLRIKIHIVEY